MQKILRFAHDDIDVPVILSGAKDLFHILFENNLEHRPPSRQREEGRISLAHSRIHTRISPGSRFAQL